MATGRPGRAGSVSVLFAAMIIPMIIMAGLAVDYSFYVQAQSQLATAADAGAMHAVRIAAARFIAGQTVAQSIVAGTTAGKQWFEAQLGNITDADIPQAGEYVPQVQYSANTGTFTETIGYSGTVATRVAAGVTGITSWPIGGSASASISADNFSEFLMLIDNSSSMLIGATPADIVKLENLTVCAPTAVASGAQQALMSAYSWTYPNTASTSYGYDVWQPAPPNGPYVLQTVPTQTVIGRCDPNFSGDVSQCRYPQSLPGLDKAGFCPPGTGIPERNFTRPSPNINARIDPVTGQTANDPQAPCGFACHTGDGTNDYYSLARKSGQGITLRFDVVQEAAANVVQTLISKQQITNQFALGVFQFNNAVSQVHPAGSSFVESDTDLTQGGAHIRAVTTPLVQDSANTDFPDAIKYLAANLQPAGDGSSITRRTKNLFIVTDGLEDDTISGRTIGPMTTLSPEPYCSLLKSMGFSIYVLYTAYYPLPNPFYLNNGARSYVEPTSPPAESNPVIAALQACASSPQQFYQATDTAGINAAMQQMVQSALASPGRITN